MRRTTLELNKIWDRALRAAFMILPLALSGCFDDKKTDPPPAESFDLAVSITGSGSVSSSPAGIDCGSDCVETLTSGNTITLSATPTSGAMFTGWGGDCSGSTPSCTLTMSASRAVTASFTFTTDPPPPAAQYTLSVSVTGTGSVSSSPAGVSCRADCTENYTDGTSVTLTAAPDANQQFSGWANACAGTQLTCTVSMTEARSVSASFTPVLRAFTVTVNGTGSVTSTPAGINCGTDCSENYAHGSNVTLTASPGTNQQFSGWLGACSGTTTTCTVAMTEARSVTATFAPIPAAQFMLTVNVTGSGSVASSPAGISCGGDCSESYASDQSVTLTATAEHGFQFSSWGGACSGSGTCVVAMNMNQAVTATFTNGTLQILFEEHFDTPGANLFYGFDYAKFGDSNPARPWDREHLPTGGVNGGGAFQTRSTFDSINSSNGTSYYFMKDFTGSLATHSRDFWVRQCMKYSEGFIDARIMRPINPKINYFIATNGGMLNYSATSGAFLARERVMGQNARADFFQPGATAGRVTNVVGTFQAGETLVGAVSGATATFNSYAPQWRNMQLNHFWHPGDAGDGSRGEGFQDLRWQDQTNGYYFPANNPLNEVRHTNFLILQEHYDEWMCIETHIDMDQVPWLVEIYVTTAPGAATLAAGTTATDTRGRRQFNDYLYIRFSNPVAPALEPGFGINWNEYGSYGGALPGDRVYFDEMVIATGKVGHPF